MQQLMHHCHPMLTTHSSSVPEKTSACMDIEEWGSLFTSSQATKPVSQHLKQPLEWGEVFSQWPPGAQVVFKLLLRMILVRG